MVWLYSTKSPVFGTGKERALWWAPPLLHWLSSIVRRLPSPTKRPCESLVTRPSYSPSSFPCASLSFCLEPELSIVPIVLPWLSLKVWTTFISSFLWEKDNKEVVPFSVRHRQSEKKDDAPINVEASKRICHNCIVRWFLFVYSLSTAANIFEAVWPHCFKSIWDLDSKRQE